MNNTIKKIVATITGLALAATMAPGLAQALTAEELQDQIDALLAQLQTLQSQLAQLQGTTPTVSGCTITSFDRNLKLGMTGDDVKCLQIVLNSDAATQLAASGVGSAGNETSYFGPLTQAAVVKFQEKYAEDCLASWGLTSGTGFVGSTTRAKLNSLLAAGEEEEEEEEVPAAGLSVTLAANTPASATYVRDNTAGTFAQAVADFVKFNFTASKEGAAKVTTLKLTRSGVSADSDLSNVYLYEGNTKLAEMTSFTSKVITFNNAAGLFTVAAGTTKAIMVKADIAASTATVASIVLGINSAAGITTDASAVSGTFPINGNAMAVGTVADLGYANITSTTTFPATIDPGVTNYELWRFNVTANDQKIELEKVVLTMVGTVTADDVINLKLEVAGTQIGSTVEKVDANNQAVFDLTASPGYEIPAGQTKTVILKGDVPTGTNRAFKFTIRTVSDFIVKDTNYGVYVAPLSGGAAFTLIDPDAAGDGTNINVGTLTIGVADDSPTGNVASAAPNVPLARFTYKANGEAIKVTIVKVSVNEEAADQDIDNGKLYYNGSQVGTTDTAVADEATVSYSLGNAVIIPGGETGVFEYRADITQGGGTALAASQTIVVSLVAGTTDATGQESLSSIATSAAAGKTLTVATGALTVAKNLSLADATVTNPTGVVGAANVKVASFVLTAGSGEGVTVTQVVVGDDGDDATEDFGDNFQNLKLMHNSTKIGNTQGTLSGVAGTDWTFTPTPSIVIAAGQQYVIDAYADILTGAAGYGGARVGLEFVSATATGNTTSANTSNTTVADLHSLVISAVGTLTISANAAQPLAGQMVMGAADQVFAMLNFTAGSAENVNVSRIEISDTTSYGGSLSNVKLYDYVAGTQVGATVASLDATDDAEFNLTTSWVIPKNDTKVLVVKATPNAYPSATSGGSHILGIGAAADVDSMGADSGTAIAETVSSAVGNAQDIYRTKATLAKNASSPSGASVAGAGATVLMFDVTADTGRNVILNTVAVQSAGSVDTTSNGDANLYKSTNLTTALATESYVQDLVSVSAAPTGQSLAVTGSASDWDGIPVGATVLVNDTSVSTTAVLRAEVVSVTSTVLTATVVGDISGYAGIDVGVTYRPIQPGVGKTYFGAQSALKGDLATGATTVDVISTDGFATGDTVTFVGYSAAGVLTTSTAGGVITQITDADTLVFSAVTLAATIDYNYLATAANAVTKGFTGNAVGYTGLISTTGEQITAGTTTTFVVKGDTTGGTNLENLRVDIAAVGDVNWDDTLIWQIITDTSGLPVTGGTLTY